MGLISVWRRRGELSRRIKRHFSPLALDRMVVAERKFPNRMRADVQHGLDKLFGKGAEVFHFTGIAPCKYGTQLSLASLASDPSGLVPCAPFYEEVNIGEDAPVRCLQGGLWLGQEKGVRFVLLMLKATSFPYGEQYISIQVGVVDDSSGKAVETLFDRLGDAVRASRCYRGKVLSLEESSRYSGESQGINVHKLHSVAREEVILPRATLELLERNVLRFVQNREQLGRHGQSCKKGLLFYGPPGTGKTHTLHFLAGAMAGHTTLLISAEQVGLLGEYMTLARLLQPSMVVIEDADLIARDRAHMQNICEEVLLNKLLNEMDGLKEDAEILFVLTTNRPEALEAALTSRPGRIDQAIEFPLPDEEGRKKLVVLYARGMTISDSICAEIVKRTDRASAAFIKELMRRALQFHLERGTDSQIQISDVQEALEEMIFRGGSLNLKLLGGTGVEGGSC